VCVKLYFHGHVLHMQCIAVCCNELLKAFSVGTYSVVEYALRVLQRILEDIVVGARVCL